MRTVTRLSALLAAVMASFPPAAQAQDSAQDPMTVSRSVSLRGLDLTSADGLREARARIARAAHAVCDLDGARDLLENAGAAECREDAMRLASVQLQAIAAARSRTQYAAMRDAGGGLMAQH